MNVAFVDTETTGLDPERNPIWEIAVIIPDGPDQGEHVWQQQLPLNSPSTNGSDRMFIIDRAGSLPIIADGERAPRYSANINRWVLDNTRFADDYDHDTALRPDNSIERFARLVSGRHLVGAVPSFDEERLRRLYRKHVDPTATRFPWHYHLIDVEALMVGYLLGDPEGDWRLPLPWKSDDLSTALGVTPPDKDRHTALGDARWAKTIYDTVIKEAR